MRNIPSQLVLVILVMVTIAVTNLVPRSEVRGELQKLQEPSDKYLAPEVTKTSQSDYLILLRIDRRDVGASSVYSRAGSDAVVADCVESYNSIASQMDSDLLIRNKLPLSIN